MVRKSWFLVPGVAVLLAWTLSGCSNSTAPAAHTTPNAAAHGTDTSPHTEVAQVTVPDVVGMTRSDARRTLQNRGLAAVDANVATTGTDPLVVGQDPVAGESIALGTVERLTFEPPPSPSPSPSDAPVTAPPPVPTLTYAVWGNGSVALITYVKADGSFGITQ
ncbi:MAG: PASTA domain-containing protein, partial [Leifsonia sp.]